MTFRAGKTQSMAPDRRRSGLVVGLRRADTGEVTMLDTKPRKWVIGADPSCDVPVGDDPFVSACHCVIERRENGVVLVRDRNSRNGTFVDGAAIEGAELMIGSYLSVGRTTFVAVAGAGSATVPAVELIVGQDPVLRRALDMAVKAAASDCSVLILGETGTGKDLFARMIHERSRRANARFVPVNCGGIPRELIASELFGHEKGAFTGATEARDGFFLEASGGTLFLDEIGELPLDLQSHLLRALENRTVRRVGGTVEKVVNARIVAATNRTEGLGTDAGRLRADLYHRIATIVIVLPPLRERMGDLALLVNAQLDELAPTHGHKMILPEAWAALQRHSWPGNVRELRAAVRRAVMMGGEELGVSDFFAETAISMPFQRPAMVDEEDDDLQKLETVQRELMEKALARYGTIRAAAAALGMPKSTFADRARQLQLAVPGRKRIAGVARRRYIGLTPPLPTGALGPPPGVPPLPSSVPSLPSLVPSGDEMSVEPEHASEHDGDYGWDDDAGEHELVACADEHEHAGRAGERAPSWPEPAAADAWAPEACAEEPRSAAAADETSMFELSSSDNVLDAFGLQRLPAKAASASTACESGGPANEASASGAVGAACAGDEYFVGPDASTTPDEAPPAHMVTRDSREAL